MDWEREKLRRKLFPYYLHQLVWMPGRLMCPGLLLAGPWSFWNVCVGRTCRTRTFPQCLREQSVALYFVFIYKGVIYFRDHLYNICNTPFDIAKMSSLALGGASMPLLRPPLSFHLGNYSPLFSTWSSTPSSMWTPTSGTCTPAS